MKKFTDKINESKEEFDPKELEMGIKIESEHGDVFDDLRKWVDDNFIEVGMPWSERTFYEKIAKSHLREIPDYYTRLNKMENE